MGTTMGDQQAHQRALAQEVHPGQAHRRHGASTVASSVAKGRHDEAVLGVARPIVGETGLSYHCSDHPASGRPGKERWKTTG